VALACCLTCPAVRRAHAQTTLDDSAVAANDLDLDSPLDAVGQLLSSIMERSQDELFRFLETVELFNAEAEIDRLVGDPHVLNDSTAYKLSLLPFHIRYPIYKQIVRQMTRQDDLRSRRLHNSTVDSSRLIVLRIETLSDENVEEEVRRNILTHFNAREIVDLGFFIAAQRTFFPQTEEGWRELRHNLAQRTVAIASGILLAGAAFDVGAISQSGKIASFARDRARLGWYAGARRLGFSFRPQLRGGLTASFPRLQLALGLSERIRPTNRDADRAVEFAVREGWLNQMVSPRGWDIFCELAVRRYIDAEAQYRGDRTAARGGLFWKRDHLPGLPHIVLRGSAELDWRAGTPTQHAVSLGFDHTRASLSLIFQASRTRLPVDRVRTADTRGGVFLAGSIDPPTQLFVEMMRAEARLTHDQWETIRALDERRARAEEELRLLGTPRLSTAQARAAVARLEDSLTERELATQRLAQHLAMYLESRRRAYALARWTQRDGELFGPLAPEILSGARDEVFGRLHVLSRSLEQAPHLLRQLRERVSLLSGTIETLEATPASSAEAERERQQLLAVMRHWRRASLHADGQLRSYELYRDSARRILTAEHRGATTYEPDFVAPETLRAILALRTVPLP
jgi:hypothetical protein